MGQAHQLYTILINETVSTARVSLLLSFGKKRLLLLLILILAGTVSGLCVNHIT